MFAVKHVTDGKGNVLVQDPPIAQFLFSNSKAGWIWLVVRVYIGYQWLTSGWGKFNNPAWMDNGDAIMAYWTRALGATPDGKPIIVYDWYRVFIQALVDSGAHPWFAKLIAIGELLIGIGLLVGGLTAIAAFFALLLNFSFIYAGSTSSNPTMIILSALIIVGWRAAGWWGLDRVLLPLLGTPWGRLERPSTGQMAEAPPRT